MEKKIKVLIVDDSALVRDILEKGLSSDPQIEVVGKAMDVYIARDMIVNKQPDVLTLDVEMPRMNGVEFLKRLMPQYPLPVIMVSSLTERHSRVTFEALEAGALDFVLKPSALDKDGLKKMLIETIEKIKTAAKADVSHYKKTDFSINKISSSAIPNRKIEKIIAIGASAGGTVATKKIISALPRNIPGIVVTQHMPAGFTKMYAETLQKSSDVEVREARDGDRIEMGKVLIAPGNFQMTVVKQGGSYSVECKRSGEKVSGHCTLVDVLFHSVANNVGKNAIGVILTGMGKDGAEGLLQMKKIGARTLGQNKESCVVFGMPMEAQKLGAVEKFVDIEVMAHEIIKLVNEDEARIASGGI